MRVPHLTDLLTWEEIWTCQDVYRFGRDNRFGPIQLRLPDEISGCCDNANGKSYHVDRYSAKARYAKELLQLAETAVCKATGAEPERVEWVPVSVSFNTIRYPNLDAEAYVRDVMREMERLANSGTLSVRTGIKFLGSQKAADGEERDQLEIVLPEYDWHNSGPRLEELLKPGVVDEKDFTFRWAEVADSFAVLSPMQVAFLHEEQLHRHTVLDDELFHACSYLDESGIRTSLEKGANVHALDSSGDGVCSLLVDSFNLWWSESKEDAAHNPALAEKLLRLLLDHGADLDLAGTGTTALYNASLCASWMTELLLKYGAGPDVPSWVAAGERPETPLEKIRGEDWFVREYERTPDDMDAPNVYRAERLLVRAGAGDFVMRDRDMVYYLEAVPEMDLHAPCMRGLAKIQQELLAAVRSLRYGGVLAAVRSGVRIEDTDACGRNWVQVAMEDSREVFFRNSYATERTYHFAVTNFVLFLLGHMKVPMEADDFRLLAETCRRLGETELLGELENNPLFGERFREAVGGNRVGNKP